MSEYDEEGQSPEEQPAQPASDLPARPTVRESLRRGLFVRLPTEGESSEGLPEATTEEEGAETYEGWRQTEDGGWEPVSPEAQAYYAQAYEPPPPEPYPESGDSANFASVAGGEPFFQPEESAASAWTFGGYPGAPAESAEPVAEAPPAEPVPEQVAEPAVEPSEISAAPEAAAPAPVEVAPAVEPEPAIEPEPAQPPPAPATPVASEDPVAASGIYIPPDVELLEVDVPVYGEKDKIAPIFKGEGLGEPLFIDFADLPEMLTGLRRLLPPKTRLTYNYDYERAWVRATAEVDLVAIAEQIKAGGEASPPVST